MARFPWQVPSFGFLLLLAGCGGGSGGGGAPPVPNARPFVAASATSPSLVGSAVTLFGAAEDPDGDPIAYLWTLLSQPAGAAVVVDAPTAPVTSLSGPMPVGAYEFSFSASDGTTPVEVLVALLVEDLPAPGPTAEAYEADRQALPLAGFVQVTAPSAGATPYLPPLAYTAYEGGWSGLGLAKDALGGPVSDEFWIVNDRGPNYGISLRVPVAPAASTAFGAGAKIFPLAGYQQKLQRVRLHHGTGAVEVLSTTGLRTRSGAPTVGLPSSVPGMTTAETAWGDVDDKGSSLPASVNGWDFEGIVEDRVVSGGVSKRVLFACDEYGPALAMFEGDPASPDFGRMLREYVPGAVEDKPAGLYALPALLRQRRDNRGFEGLAATDAAVWAMVQSNLKASFGSATSRLHRLVRVDKRTDVVTMYGYDHVADPAAYGSTHAGVKVGDMVALSEHEFLVLEHDGAFYAHVYRVRLTPQTTVLAEGENGAYEKGLTPYVPVEKTLVADLTELLANLRTPTKPEGLVLVDPSTLALCFDNDYGFNSDETNVFPTSGDAARNMVVLVHLPTPVVPSLRAAADWNPGIGTNNCEIPAVDATLGLGLVSCEGDAAVQVFDLADPTFPFFARRDGVGTGALVSVAAHAGRGYYLAAVRAGGASGQDVLRVVDTATGALLRTIDLGTNRGPDAVAIAKDGRWAVVCLEAEDPWRPGGVAVLELGTGPFPDAVTAAAAIGDPTFVELAGLVPSTGAFSTRWIDRIYNVLPAGVTVTSGGFPVVIVDESTRAQANGIDLPEGADVLFTEGAASATSKYKFDLGGDGHVFLFQLDATANSLEPEYAAFDEASTLCVVTLQENNAVVVLDLTGPVPAIRAVNGVMGLGKVDVPDADLTNSGAGAAGDFKSLLSREREPDGVAVATLGGVPCFVTVDEGDTYGTTSTESSNSRYRGGRTLSVYRLSDGALLGDTGNQLDAAANAAGRWGAFVEAGNRARRGGSEPENLALLTWGDRVLAVVGLERANALALVDVTNPAAPGVIDVAGIGGLGANARTGPEGIAVLTSGGRTFLVTGFEVSGTVGIFELR